MELINEIYIYDIKIFISLFFIYAFLGWCMESFGSIINPKVKKFVNRGFLLGPYCPVYGIGVVLITMFLNKYQEDCVTVFLLSIIICGVLEYFTSYVMEKCFGARWWDYSKNKYNINGRVCLETLIPFGIFGSCTLCIINPWIIDKLYLIPNEIFSTVIYVLVGLFFVDTIISLVIINSFKNITFKEMDNTEQISSMVKEKTSEIVEEISDKTEDFAMKAASDIIVLGRKIKVKGLKLERNIHRYKLSEKSEKRRKDIIDLIDKIRYQRKLLSYRAKERAEELIAKIKDEKEKREIRNAEIRKKIEEKVKLSIKDKSIWYGRLVDAFPNMKINHKKK